MPTKRKSNALATQVGGNHYKSMAIQPMEYSMVNNLNACQHTAIKYITRYKMKNGKQDIEKAIHTLQLLLEIEYPDKPKTRKRNVTRKVRRVHGKAAKAAPNGKRAVAKRR